MKVSTFIQVAVVLALIGFAAIGCASSRQYPDSRRYPYPDSRRYPGDDRPIVIYPNSLPPGQAKKIYGERSARRFAPGHNKRYGSRRYDDRRYDDRRYDDRRYDNRRHDREKYYDKHDGKSGKGNGKKKSWK